MPYEDPSSGKGSAFFKGGMGCLAAFFGIGLICVLFGGTMTIDAGGFLLLFLIGGGIGIIVLSIHNKGKRDARRELRQQMENGHDADYRF